MAVLQASIPASKGTDVALRSEESGTVLTLCQSNPGPTASLAANGAVPWTRGFLAGTGLSFSGFPTGREPGWFAAEHHAVWLISAQPAASWVCW
jgi:hypothetical protein